MSKNYGNHKDNHNNKCSSHLILLSSSSSSSSSSNAITKSEARPLVPTIKLEHPSSPEDEQSPTALTSTTSSTSKRSSNAKCPLLFPKTNSANNNKHQQATSDIDDDDDHSFLLNNSSKSKTTNANKMRMDYYHTKETVFDGDVGRGRTGSSSSSSSASFTTQSANIELVDFSGPSNHTLQAHLSNTPNHLSVTHPKPSPISSSKTSVIHELVYPRRPSPDLSALDEKYLKQQKACAMAFQKSTPHHFHSNRHNHLNQPSQNQENQNDYSAKFDSALMTIGSAAMYSSPSLLAVPTGAIAGTPTSNLSYKPTHYSSTKVWDHGTPINGGTLSYLPTNQSSLTGHPLINETRTRSLSRAKLKQSSQVSALLSGFALVAMVEMDINNPSTIPLPVLMFFIITTTLLVSVHMIALMISTCILPHIDSMIAMQDLALALGTKETGPITSTQPDQPITSAPSSNQLSGDADYQFHHNHSTYTNQNGASSMSAYGEPPHHKMRWYISIAWFFSTVIGIFLFILELVAIVWVKFWDHNRSQDPTEEDAKLMSDGKMIATISTLLLIPVLLSLIYFAFHFYRKLVLLRYEMAQKVLEELNDMAGKIV